MRRAVTCRLFVAAILCCTALSAQDEGTGPRPNIPRRQTLSGTILPGQSTKTFPLKLGPGVYHVTYISKSARAVVQVVADGALIGQSSHTQPFATVMHIVNGDLRGTVDFPPTGLCSSDAW